MHNDWSVLGVRVVIHDVSDSSAELQQGVGERIGVAGPLRVVEKDDLAFLASLEEMGVQGAPMEVVPMDRF